MAKREYRIEVLEPLCKGCYICVGICPKDVFEVGPRPGPGGFRPVEVARPEACTGCRLCVIYCPDFAVEVTPRDLVQAQDQA